MTFGIGVVDLGHKRNKSTERTCVNEFKQIKPKVKIRGKYVNTFNEKKNDNVHHNYF